MQPVYLVHTACLECKLQIYLIHKALWGNFQTSYIQQSQKRHQSEGCSLAKGCLIQDKRSPLEQEDSVPEPHKGPSPHPLASHTPSFHGLPLP